MSGFSIVFVTTAVLFGTEGLKLREYLSVCFVYQLLNKRLLAVLQNIIKVEQSDLKQLQLSGL
jgi:hypothetical protein